MDIGASHVNMNEKCCGSLWDTFGECLAEIITKQDCIRPKRECAKAWISLISFLVGVRTLQAHSYRWTVWSVATWTSGKGNKADGWTQLSSNKWCNNTKTGNKHLHQPLDRAAARMITETMVTVRLAATLRNSTNDSFPITWSMFCLWLPTPLTFWLACFSWRFVRARNFLHTWPTIFYGSARLYLVVYGDRYIRIS